MMSKQKHSPTSFQGFQSPNYTNVPDELFDQLMVDLTGAELKVLLYIIRRTFGFKRDSDNISLSQMLNGLQTRDGRTLDRGVGLSKKTLLQALNSLEEKQVILTERRQSPEKGNEPTTYRLNIVSSTTREKTTPPLGEKVHQGVGEEIPPRARSKNYTTQYTEGNTESNDSNIRKAFTREETNEGSTPQAPTAAQQPIRESLPHDNTFASVGSLLSEPPPPTLVYDDDRQQILSYLEDFARELGDQAPLKSSVTRAYHLYQRTGKPIAMFIDAMYQARAITKERSASIRRSAESGGVRSPKNKTAYFFSVLEDVLGLKPEDNQKTYPNGRDS